MIATPGIYPHLRGEYRFGNVTPTRALTASGIKILRDQTPLDFITPRKRKSAAMDMGTIVHKLALGHGDDFVVSPYDEFRTKEAREWKADQLELGATIIKPDDYVAAQDMAAVIKERLHWATQGQPYETEVPFYWTEQVNGATIWCSGMMDVWCPSLGLIIDPKITDRVSSERAAAHMHAMGWPLQVAWYKRGLDALLPDWSGRLTFLNLLIKPDEPYTHRLVRISEGWRTAAEKECIRALRLFAECQATDEWPGYPEEIEYLDPPAWAVRQAIEAEMMEE